MCFEQGQQVMAARVSLSQMNSSASATWVFVKGGGHARSL